MPTASGKLYSCTDELMRVTGEDQPMGSANDISSDGGISQKSDDVILAQKIGLAQMVRHKRGQILTGAQ